MKEITSQYLIDNIHFHDGELNCLTYDSTNSALYLDLNECERDEDKGRVRRTRIIFHGVTSYCPDPSDFIDVNYAESSDCSFLNVKCNKDGLIEIHFDLEEEERSFPKITFNYDSILFETKLEGYW